MEIVLLMFLIRFCILVRFRFGGMFLFCSVCSMVWWMVVLFLLNLCWLVGLSL